MQEASIPTYPYQIIRRNNRKKTVSIQIDMDNTISILAPNHTPTYTILTILKEKKLWIAKQIKQNKESQLNPLFKPKTFTKTDRFLYQGKILPLTIAPGSKPLFRARKNEFYFEFPACYTKIAKATYIQMQLISWYQKQAEIYIPKRVSHFQEFLEKPNKITIKHLKSRYGSCSSDGNLSFNLRIMMAPPSVIDYLVVHELCHLKYLNHSKPYWALVHSIMPNYAESETWLKENGLALEL